MHKRLLLILLLLSAVSVGCNKDEQPDETVLVDASVIESATQYVQFTGGVELENANAKALLLKPTKNGAQAVLTFMLGSSVSSVDEAAASSVPAYKAYMTSAPARFVLEFDNLDYWDYYRQLDIPADSIFFEVFKQLQSDSNTFRIVFQLRTDCDVKIKEEKNNLVINFTSKESQPENKYYVIADDELYFNTGAVKYVDGYFPSMCNDLDNVVLLSKPFDTTEAAETFAVETASMLGYTETFVVTLNGNSLPAFSNTTMLLDVFTHKVMSMDGVGQTLPVVMPDGMYLCMTQDGTTALFSKQNYDMNTASATETLWLMDSTGKLKQLSEIEFADISLASFSPDSKKLGIVERTPDTSYLYIYDMETNVLTNLSEEGLGNTTSTFIWDTLGTALYAISGNETQQLLKYDFMIPDESIRISAVEEREMSEGDLGFYNGEIYFTHIDEEDNELIFKIKPEGGLRTKYADGGTFEISSDGKQMAILTSKSADEGEENAGNSSVLRLKDTTTGDEKNIINGPYVLSYHWSPDGKLYYTIGKSEELNEEFSFALYSYEPSTDTHTHLGDTANSEFYATNNPNILYIPYISDDGIRIRATYELKLK